MRVVPSLLLVAVAVAVAPPADAAPGVGPKCSFVRRDPGAGGSERNGTLLGGPYVMPGSTWSRMTCFIQLDSADPATPDATSRSSANIGPVASLYDDAVTYQANATDTAYVCTSVSWSGSASSGTASLGCSAVPLG